MLLQRLVEFADQLDLPPTLYNEVPVRYIIELDQAGDYRGLVDTADPSNKRTKRGTSRLVPQVQRAVGIKPLLLADNAEYTLGLRRENSRPERAVQCHTAYLDLIGRCAEWTDNPLVAAVNTFLCSDTLAQVEWPEDFDRDALVTFRVNDEFVVNQRSVQEFWAAENDPASVEGQVHLMQCLVCGQRRPVLDRLQGKIKGIPGGQTSGTSIISANALAFESYGLEASLIAPTCASCGERFTKALNRLIADERHRIILGSAGLVFTYWTREPVGDFWLGGFLTEPDTAQVHGLIDAFRTGRRVAEVDDTAFYAANLSASGGRAVVRDWIDTTVGQVKESLARWFTCQEIVDAYGDKPRPLGLYALAAATVRDARKDLATPTPRTLLYAALTGNPVPWGLLQQAVRRNRAEQNVTHARAALIKLVLLSQLDVQEDSMVRLNPDHPNAAYQCGRLLAVLESAQRLAVRNINTTIVDRFYGTASTVPAVVFSRLLRGAQPHLAKIERDNPGAYVALQRRLEEVIANISEFPRVLSLEDQGIFALGYYHQRAHDRAQAIEASKRRKAGEPSNDASTETNS